MVLKHIKLAMSYHDWAGKNEPFNEAEEGKIVYKVFVTPEYIDDLTIYLRNIRRFYSILN